MKKWVLVLFLISSLTYAWDISYADDICFSEQTAREMIVYIEQCNIIRQQVEVLKEANKELEYQVRLLKEINTLRVEQVDKLQDLVKLQKDAYEGIIKESKPSVFKSFVTGIGYLSIGILIGLVL